MPGALDLKPVLTFLTGLQKNNNKPWFEQHRGDYERAKGEFEALVDELILGLGAIEDMKGVAAKDCTMRIYRDIRFSKDKSPYKIAMGASIGPEVARLGASNISCISSRTIVPSSPADCTNPNWPRSTSSVRPSPAMPASSRLSLPTSRSSSILAGLGARSSRPRPRATTVTTPRSSCFA